MDTKTFLVKRQILEARLIERRSADVSDLPFRLPAYFGVRLPVWSRLALSFASRRSSVGTLLGFLLPVASSFLLRKQRPYLSRILEFFFLSKA